MSSLKTVDVYEGHFEKGSKPGWHFKGAASWRGGECQFTTSTIDGLNFSGDKPPKSVIADIEKVLAEAETMHLEFDVSTGRWEIVWEE